MFTAHFRGNASGGVPPYQFSWNFGDGSPPSTEESPSHVFVRGSGWNVTLNVTDAAMDHASASLYVAFPAFSCPAELVSPPAYQTPFAVVLAAIVVIAAVTSILLRRRRARRNGGRSP